MAKSAPFVLPESVELNLDGDTLSIDYDGDVVIEQTFGKKLGTVRAGGDLTIRLPVVNGTLLAGGVLRVSGEIDAVSLKGRQVVVSNASVKARAIAAEQSITIGAAKLQVDAVLAPHIDIDPKASGRVTVIQSNNERNPTKIKGGFSLADYEDMFGDAAGFLAERGVEAPDGDSTFSAPMSEDDEVVELAPTQAAKTNSGDDEDVDDPLSLSIDDLEPIQDAGEDGANVQAKLTDALERITACYEGADMPPAVSELRSLVEDGDIGSLQNNITEVWNGLLGFHQKRGIRPHHQVTHAFNVIHSLVS